MEVGQACSQSVLVRDTTIITRFERNLSLTKEQAIKLRSLIQLHQFSIDSIIKTHSLNPVEKHKQIALLMKEREEKIKSVLTAEQFNKMQLDMQNALGDKRKKFKTQLEIIKERERVTQVNQVKKTYQ